MILKPNQIKELVLRDPTSPTSARLLEMFLAELAPDHYMELTQIYTSLSSRATEAERREERLRRDLEKQRQQIAKLLRD